MAEVHSNVYIRILLDSMKKKERVLQYLLGETKEQSQILSEELFNIDNFDRSMERKELLIEELNQLDNGFETTYERVKEELKKGKEKYQTEIIELKKLITSVTDISVKIQALEQRNKKSMEQCLIQQKQEIKQMKMNNQTAVKYYNQMAGQYQASQSYFLDSKK